MEISNSTAASYSYSSISIKQQSVVAQYNSVSNGNNTNRSSSITSNAYSLDISYEARYAQAESKIYKNIEDKVNSKPEVAPGQAKKAESFDEFFSPEKVAERITDFARSLFPMWYEQNQKEGQTKEDAVNEFMTLVNQGVEDGFNEAKEILKGFGEFSSGKEDTFNKTYELTKAGLENLTSVLLDDIDYIKEYLARHEEDAVAKETEDTTVKESPVYHVNTAA